MALRMLVGVVLVTGCFQPHVKNGGFACEPTDDPPCPSGFYCVRGSCVDTPPDIGTSGGGDLGGASDLAGSSTDFATTIRDLAQSWPDLTKSPPPDLAPAPDLATGMCGHAGAPCTSVNDCCSAYCRTDGICIGG